MLLTILKVFQERILQIRKTEKLEYSKTEVGFSSDSFLSTYTILKCRLAFEQQFMLKYRI